MLRHVLDDARRELVADLRRDLDDLRVTLIRGGAEEEHQRALARSLATLDEIFLLVVVGEFNAGKSAVVNALLGEHVVEEGVTPTTSRIHLLRYGKDRRRAPSGGGYEDATLPVAILREMNVVDTPGTNAVVEGHEALTRDFVPRSDLVLFVTSADRPFTASERAFLEAIRSWGKKVVIAVNKTDILDRPEDVQKVVEFVRDKTRSLLGHRPEVFAVSARRAQLVKAGAAPDSHSSGFEALEAWVTRTLDDGARLRLKLQNPIGVGLRVLEQEAAALKEGQTLLEGDEGALRDVDGLLTRFREDVGRDVRGRLAEVEKPLADLQERGKDAIDEQIALARVPGLLFDTRGPRAALDREVAAVAPLVEKRADALAGAVVEPASRVWPAVVERLAPRQSLRPARLPAVSPEPPRIDAAPLHAALRREVSRVLEGDSRAEGRRFAAAAQRAAILNLVLIFVAASLVALAALVAETTEARAELAAGAVAAVIAGLSVLAARRRRERLRFEERVGAMRRRLGPLLRTALEAEVDRVGQRVKGAVEPIARHVRDEQARIGAYEGELSRLRQALEALRARVERLR